jgi:hypothetical protein
MGRTQEAQPFASPKREQREEPEEPEETQGTKLNSFGACLLQGFGLGLASVLSILSGIHKEQTSSFVSCGSFLYILGHCISQASHGNTGLTRTVPDINVSSVLAS